VDSFVFRYTLVARQVTGFSTWTWCALWKYRRVARFTVFRLRTSVSLPPDPSVYNVVVQEGEREGQEAVSWKNLFMVGNTNPITDLVEVNVLRIEDGIHPRTFHQMRNKMLLYDVSWPFDRNESRANLFPTDLSDYIGLSTPLDRPKIRQKSRNAGLAIYICDDKLISLRMELVKNGMAAAERMLTYFRVCADVTMWQYPRRNTFETSFQLGQTILANNWFEIITSNHMPKISFNLYIKQAPPNYSIGSFFRRCRICSFHSCTTLS
jgi:hypothetical protein